MPTRSHKLRHEGAGCLMALPLTIELSGRSDDADLRRLLRETPLPGAIELSFEREPSFSRAAAIEGDLVQTVVARDARNGELAGMASRSIAERFVDGAAQPVGYWSHLRASRSFGWGAGGALVLRRGFGLMRELDRDDRARHNLVSLVSDNHPATRLLTAGLKGYPALRPVGQLVTYAVLVGRRRSRAMPRGLSFRRARLEDLQDIAGCLARHGRRQHIAMEWTADTLRSEERTPGLSVSDFHVATRGGKLVGCVACWDQRSFKQTVVRGYGPPFERWRWAVNIAARAFGYATIPSPGEALQQAYASHVAVDDDDSSVLAGLLDAVTDDASERGIGVLTIGLPAGHALGAVLRPRRHFRYHTTLYSAGWKASDLPAWDDKPVWPEIATL